MKHLILGTAGHIDHGKTALVRAMTGIECDTHPEERKRGITINLGFAHLELPTGDSIGVVDVPGHKDFVHTMVAGASGIDIAMLVIAADEGIMPQTREHLQVMEVLGVQQGLIALTKTDLVDRDILDMAHEEVLELVEGTFLAGCPVLHVSAKTGTGVRQLLQTLGELGGAVRERAAGEVFRMFIDRIFSVSGFGTVVTGSALSGRLSVEDTAYLLPGDRELRVRRLERHGHQVESVAAGDRASMNLVGLDRDQFERGMIVADRPLRSTRLLDARLSLFAHSRPFGIWSQAIFLCGTYEAQARIHSVDRDRIAGSETALVQIHLPRPFVGQNGDRFVLRSTSNDTTLGGGEIIDAAPLHHRRRPPELVDNLRKLAEGRLGELVAAEVRKRYAPLDVSIIADALNVTEQRVADEIASGLPGDIATFDKGYTPIVIARDRHETLKQETLQAIATFHRRNPLVESGRTPKELCGILGLAQGGGDERYVRSLLGQLVNEGELKQIGHTYALASHTVKLSPAMKQQIAFVEKFLLDCGTKVPLLSELGPAAERQGIDDKQLRGILRYLVGSRKAYVSEGNYLHANVVDPIRTRLLEALAKRPEGLTVAQFRDLIGANRKMCLTLYALFDEEGISRREGDVRVITEEGKRQAAKLQKGST